MRLVSLSWRHISAISVLLVVLFFQVFFSTPLQAQTNFPKSSTTDARSETPKGITVSPAFSQTVINATETEHPISFKVTNNESVEQTLQISTADFNTLDESGGLLFVGTNPTAIQKKYGLANWIRLPETSVTISPKQTVDVNATILNEQSLSPGGHYGALMLTLPTDNSGSTKNSVSVRPIASSLLFVTKTGGETYKLRLTDVESSHNMFKLPDSVTLRFYNSGNTHLIPRGTVEIKDPKGKVVRRGIINVNSGIILPETYRRYSVPLTKVSAPKAPGTYRLTVNFRFDGYEQFRTYQTSQFLLTPIVVFLSILVLFILAAGTLLALKKREVRRFLSKQANRIKRLA